MIVAAARDALSNHLSALGALEEEEATARIGESEYPIRRL